MEVENGPYNSGYGLVLDYDNGEFNVLSVQEAGIYLPNETTGLMNVTSPNNSMIIAAEHGGKVTVYEPN